MRWKFPAMVDVPVPKMLKMLLMVMLPVFLSTRKSGLEVPTENKADDDGVVEPIENDPIKVDVAVVEVAVK